jgi:glycosyltransferase involved in cell wall biosynthesis
MRVLHVLANNQRRGAEVFAADLIDALNGDSIDQRVALLRDGAPNPVEFEAPVTKLGGQIRVPGLRVSPRTLVRLRKEISTFRPDLIQAHGGESFKHCVIAAAGAPIVYRKIGAAPSQIKTGAARAANQWLISKAAVTVATAEAVRRETIDLFRVSPERIVTIPNAVDPQRLVSKPDAGEIRRSLDIDSGPISITLGALTWEKEPLTHIQVAGQVLREIDEPTHLVVGDGPLRLKIEEAVAAHEFGKRIRVLGPRPDVADLLAVSDVLLFASRPDGMEGMPAQLIEAGVAEVPVVAYDVAGVSEIVEDGVTGYLVPYGDTADLAGRLSRVLRDERLRKEMGAAARRRCLANFDIKAVAPRYMHLYRDAVNR